MLGRLEASTRECGAPKVRSAWMRASRWAALPEEVVELEAAAADALLDASSSEPKDVSRLPRSSRSVPKLAGNELSLEEEIEALDDVGFENEATGPGRGVGLGGGAGPRTGVGPGRRVAMGVGGGRRAPTMPESTVPADASSFSPPSPCELGSEPAVRVCERSVRRLVKADRPLASMLDELASELVEVSEPIGDESMLVKDADVGLCCRRAVRFLW